MPVVLSVGSSLNPSVCGHSAVCTDISTTELVRQKSFQGLFWESVYLGEACIALFWPHKIILSVLGNQILNYFNSCFLQISVLWIWKELCMELYIEENGASSHAGYSVQYPSN